MLLELAYYIFQSFDDKQLQELKLRDLSGVSINLFWVSGRIKEALKDVPNDRIKAIVMGESYYTAKTLNNATDHINALLCPTNKHVEKINSCSKSLLLSTRTIFAWDKEFVNALDSIYLFRETRPKEVQSLYQVKADQENMVCSVLHPRRAWGR